MTSSLMPLIAFGAVVAMIPLALWLMRRSGIGGAGTPGLLRNVGSLSLSPSQRVVVVELMQGANARWLVVGVSPDRITTLTTLDAPDEVPTEILNPQAHSVSQLINRWRRNTGGQDGNQP
ncbi:MAG TPA: flagellar biosynthetic protein FliO [Ideonella sp.]|uniref:FliO/MopB family protein n=1 Tax=Ideonella sp. TaxID=1929293 RepID=UPI002BB09E16|nr:flagellar biosynthetic protein FliO [Ideonella sp.]HSI52089.1 flagellar biosynthetic protein FliO [Ideonella sp.]